MSRSSLAAAVGELDQLKRQLRFMEALRAAAAGTSGRLNQLEPAICALVSSDLDLLELSFNRRSDHYVTYAAGYAVLESFINDMAKSMLRFYERSGNYNDLASPTKTALRVGTARDLSRLNWRRFAHLSELEVAKNYYDAVSGVALTFSDEVIIGSDANFRADEIREAFRKCGFGNVWNEVQSDHEVKDFLSNTILEDNSLSSILNMFVSRRNEVAHGVVKSIDSTDILIEVLSFLGVLFGALYRAASKQFLQLIGDKGRIRPIGTIIHRYGNQIGIVALSRGERVTVSDVLLVKRGATLARRIVENIRVDEFDLITCTGSHHLEIGIDFGSRINRGSMIFRPADLLDVDVI